MKAVGLLKPVSRTTLSEQVALQLAAEVAAKRWEPGDKLPSEAELCRAFNVGRSTLREALKSLAFVGIIRMRAGGGSYVAERPSKYVNRPLLARGVRSTEKDVNDLSEARLVLETELASLCAQRATRHDLATLADLVRKMKAAKDEDRSKFQELDLEFHLSIAASSKNEVLAELLGHIRGALQELIQKSLLPRNGMELACKQHERIFEALKQRNPAAARKAIRAHLNAFQRGYNSLRRAKPGSPSTRKAAFG
jgi:GntR family transcriptional regulator, transcriptional repressor for pyruvate dehydrogenase complex